MILSTGTDSISPINNYKLVCSDPVRFGSLTRDCAVQGDGEMNRGPKTDKWTYMYNRG